MLNLAYAERLEGWPKAIPKPRAAKGPKGLGLRYERRVGKALAACGLVRREGWRVEHGPWFAYAEVGDGHRSLCQPDFILTGPAAGGGTAPAWLLEVKYSWVPGAEEKLRGLYWPVVEKAGVRVAGCLTVVKVMHGQVPGRVALGLREGLRAAELGTEPVILHWCMGVLDG